MICTKKHFWNLKVTSRLLRTVSLGAHKGKDSSAIDTWHVLRASTRSLRCRGVLLSVSTPAGCAGCRPHLFASTWPNNHPTRVPFASLCHGGKVSAALFPYVLPATTSESAMPSKGFRFQQVLEWSEQGARVWVLLTEACQTRTHLLNPILPTAGPNWTCKGRTEV